MPKQSKEKQIGLWALDYLESNHGEFKWGDGRHFVIQNAMSEMLWQAPPHREHDRRMGAILSALWQWVGMMPGDTFNVPNRGGLLFYDIWNASRFGLARSKK